MTAVAGAATALGTPSAITMSGGTLSLNAAAAARDRQCRAFDRHVVPADLQWPARPGGAGVHQPAAARNLGTGRSHVMSTYYLHTWAVNGTRIAYFYQDDLGACDTPAIRSQLAAKP
jgi:hypothetical protein